MVTTSRVPLHARFDLPHGGRWVSLSGGGREWLWSRPDPARATVTPGSAFVDAGGLEECVPTVRGTPDHGEAWARPWSGAPAEAAVTCDAFELRRTVTREAGAVVAGYRLAADPGYAFVWAAHALLDLSAHARIVAPTDTPVRLYPEAAPLLDGPWPPATPRLLPARDPGPGRRAGARGQDGRAPFVEGRWPVPLGLPLDRLGPDDGTAAGAVLRCPAVRVEDGRDALDLRVEAPDGVPLSTALWRNLGGFPEGAPYRSVGVEPMLGAVFDLAEAGPGDAAVVPSSGELTWRLVLAAERMV